MTINTTLVAMLLCTQLVLTLYGAGIRRPFGSLATVGDLPKRLRSANRLTLAADILFVVFLTFMWWFFISHMDLLMLVVLAITFTVVGEFLTHRIRLMPSFFVSTGLIAFCLLALWHLESASATQLTMW